MSPPLLGRRHHRKSLARRALLGMCAAAVVDGRMTVAAAIEGQIERASTAWWR
jgi:hypothetical protein